MRDNDDAEVLLNDNDELYHTDCGQTVTIEDGKWRCVDCELDGDAPQVHPGGWLRDKDGAWVKSVGDGTVSIEVFDDEMADWPPLVEARRVPADAVVIPRSAIPDDLVERLRLLDGFLSEDPNWDGSALRRYLRIAARLLSGGATEGDER